MKKISIFTILSFVFILSVTAQVDRSQKPEPGPAPTIQLGDFESFELDNGMKVIVVENDQVPVVSFQLTLDIDPLYEGEAKGYTDLAGSLMREGTANRSKKEIDEAIDFIGGSLSTSSTGMFGSSLTRHQETLLELMSDILLNPSFPEEEMDRLIKQNKSGLATVENNATAMANNVARAVTYGHDHPYGEVTTEESLDNITREQITGYYEDHFKPNVAYMVIVGDMTTEEAQDVMETYFASWEPGDVPERTYPTPEPPEGRRVAFADRSDAVQSVVRVTHPVELVPGHEDAIKASVMNSVLGGGAFSGRLMQNLREDKGYTYGARSNISTDPVIGRFNAQTEVRNEVTDTTITEILYEMQRIAEEPVEPNSLELTKNFMTGSFARSLESPRTIARFALNVERYDLPNDYYTTYLERLEAVTAEDVRAMAQKYLKPENAIIVVAGNQEEVAETLLPFSAAGAVEYYDAFGRPVEDIALEPAPEGYTAETIMDNYLEAIGGRQKMNEIQDMKQEMTASLMGQTLQLISYKKAPDMLLMETKMGENVVSKQLFDGEKGVVVSQMGRQEFTEGPQYEQLKREAVITMEMEYEEHGIEKELLGIETIDGEKAYKVEVRHPSGQTAYDYFSTETWFKIKTVTDESQSTYSDYEEVEGIMMPHSITQEVGPQMVEFTIEDVEINAGIDDETFSIE